MLNATSQMHFVTLLALLSSNSAFRYRSLPQQKRMSGLSYNMLKSLRERAVEYYHFYFTQFWISDRIRASWIWRWLHTIPKARVKNPSQTNLTSLMLCEVLRRLMSTNLVKKYSMRSTSIARSILQNKPTFKETVRILHPS